MGLKYKIVKSTRKELNEVICDRCGKSNKKESKGHWNQWGKPHSAYHESTFEKDYFYIRQSWGYNSDKDLETHEIVLCEPCYDIIFKDVKIKITSYFSPDN